MSLASAVSVEAGADRKLREDESLTIVARARGEIAEVKGLWEGRVTAVVANGRGRLPVFNAEEEGLRLGDEDVPERYTHDRHSIELKSISELCRVSAVFSIVCNSDSLFVNLVLVRPCSSSPSHDCVSHDESIFGETVLSSKFQQHGFYKFS
jgi:hypothetical protein